MPTKKDTQEIDETKSCRGCKKLTERHGFVRWKGRRWCKSCAIRIGRTVGHKALWRRGVKLLERIGEPIPERDTNKIATPSESSGPVRQPVFTEGDWVEVCGKRSDMPEAFPHDEDFNGDVGYVHIVEGRTTREGPTYPFWYSVIFPVSYDGRIKNHGNQMEEKHLKPARKPKDGISETYVDGVKVVKGKGGRR